jgi:hypothetical protein
VIFEAVEAVHPSGLMRKRNFSKADECNLRAVGDQTGDEFARISPDSAERIGCYQYAHRTLGGSRAGKTLGPT